MELSLLVDRASGGSSIKDGELELMLHRSAYFSYVPGIYLPTELIRSDLITLLSTTQGVYFMMMVEE